MVVVDIDVISDVVCVVHIYLESLVSSESNKQADGVHELSGAILANEHWTKPYLYTRKPIREERMTSSGSHGDRTILTITHLRTVLTSAN